MKEAADSKGALSRWFIMTITVVPMVVVMVVLLLLPYLQFQNVPSDSVDIHCVPKKWTTN